MGTKRNISPLTTNANFLSDLSETSISDSSNFLKNKMFLHEFFSSRGYQDIRNFRFFLFLTVLTYFSSDFYQKEHTWNSNLLKFFRYL